MKSGEFIGVLHLINLKKMFMKNIIESVSLDIAKEIITRPNFDIQEIAGIVNFRIKESLFEILLSNVEKEEVLYQKLLMEQSNYRIGSPKYVETGYKLAMAKNKKAIANRAVNNIKREGKFSLTMEYLKNNVKDFDFDLLYNYLDEKGF